MLTVLVVEDGELKMLAIDLDDDCCFTCGGGDFTASLLSIVVSLSVLPLDIIVYDQRYRSINNLSLTLC